MLQRWKITFLRTSEDEDMPRKKSDIAKSNQETWKISDKTFPSKFKQV